jgi:hypothetical protein
MMRARLENRRQPSSTRQGNACAPALFVINARRNRDSNDAGVVRVRRRKAHGADSESRILAIKKFSCSPASRPIDARQNRFFARIALTDSRARFLISRDESLGVIWINPCAGTTVRARMLAPVTYCSDAELALEQIANDLRIGLAAGRLHYLAGEPADKLRLGANLTLDAEFGF